jgi:cytosine/adenosine deaminase-related metal-dependent hydrolase/SAM-dependent methyltransferase
MLSLEQRFLEPLLPPVAGLDVVDLGCGTGRWLEKLSQKAPRSLIGIDSSTEMLARASEKVAGRAKLVNADCERPSLPSSSADLILCSFLASYISNLGRFAEEISRVARPNADVFITDVHPLTQSTLGWRRGFRMGDTHIDVATLTWSLAQVLSAFEHAGMRLAVILEPCFDDPEFRILERAGKSHFSGAMQHFPAIYILQFRKAAGSPSRNRHNSAVRLVQRICGARVAIGPQESVQADIVMDQDRVGFLGCSYAKSASITETNSSTLDLSGYLVLPGLINSHDHLEFALFPRLGKGDYRNFTEWADDIHHPDSSPVREHRSVPKDTRLWWGGIRNLLSGVTTVCHHNPYHPDVFANGFPVRVLHDFGWAHSLVMDADTASKYRGTPADQPFILHLAEGTSPQCAQEIFELNQAGALDDRTVVVHGLGLDGPGIALLKSRGAALVWCPTSNFFLFGKTHSKHSIEEFPFIALGSDSPLTSQGDLLDELRFAHDHVSIPVESLYSQITTSAAQILRLKCGEGSLRVGSVADMIAVRETSLTPAETLASCSYREIELVILAGRVQLASPLLLERLPRHLTEGLEPLDVDGCVRWIRAPVRRLFSEASSILGDDLHLNGRKVKYEHAI